MITFLFVLAYVACMLLIWVLAREFNRSRILFIALGILVSPFISIILLAILGLNVTPAMRFNHYEDE